MKKDKLLQVRLDEYTDKALAQLEQKYNMNRSELIRRCIGLFQNGKIGGILVMDVIDTILRFGGAFTILDYGFPENDYLNNGFYIRLLANFKVGLNCGEVPYGSTIIKLYKEDRGDIVEVNGGYLNDIENALKIVVASKR
ncbi:MAG: ribbon-helix-helix protein, CopG family [Lachnospiraceae bacterium]|nr:ribbon-helix-helix protein, CopG family [Lachnospiraceae bacterium]